MIDLRYPDICLYVGRTNNPKKRCNEHKRLSNKRSIGQYPDKQYLIMVIIEECSEKNQFEREYHWIEILNPGYNFKPFNPLPIDLTAQPRPIYDRLRTLDEIIFAVPWVERPIEFQKPRYL